MTKAISDKAPIATGLISGASLIGWWTDHTALSNLLPGIADMTFNTALCFMLLTLGYFLSRGVRSAGNVLALFVSLLIALFATLSLLQDIFSVSFGIDNLLFDSHGYGLRSPYPGRMSPATAIAFLLSGIILFSLTSHKKLHHPSIIIHALTLLVGMIALLGIGMNILVRDIPDGYANFASFSLFTAISFLMLSVAFIGAYGQKITDGHPILHTGIHLMYRLKYPQKFALISIVFIVPLTILMWSEIRQTERNVALSQLKISGIEHIRLTSDLFKAIAEHRGMRNASFHNPGIFKEALWKTTGKIDWLLKENGRMNPLYAGQHIVPDGWTEITSLWASIKGGRMDQRQQWHAHTKIITFLTRELRHEGTVSRLTFEEDPLLHNLLTMQLSVMPELFEDIGQLRGQGADFLASKTISSDGRLTIATLIGRTQLQLDALKRSSEVFSVSPNMVLLYSAFAGQTRSFIATSERQLLTHHRLSLVPDKYFQQAVLALAKGYALNHASLEYIEQRLQKRINENLTAQYDVKLAGMILLLILLYLFTSFYQSVISTIRVLDETAEKMRRGEVVERVELLAKDELGDVANAFNTIAGELMRVSSYMSGVVNHVAEGIITIDQHGTVRSFNAAAEHIFGYLRDEVIGQNITMLMPEKYRERHRVGLQDYRPTHHGIVADTGDSVELSGLKKGGSEFPMELSINSMHIDEQQMFIGLVRDISKRHALEEQLRHAQKMEAVGVLVGGVAHNFNNLLAAIVGKAYIGRRKVNKDSLQVIPYFEDIENISSQAGEMIKQLLAFSHKNFSQNKQNTQLDAVIREAFETTKLGVEENIHLSLHITGSDMIMCCDANQIQQVLMNLVNNARDAVIDSDHKNITVRLEKCRPDTQFFRRHIELEPDEYALLSISDSGSGMDAETMEKIFDPFFTSKAVGKGTGLGLSSAFGSITSHGGVIDVDSTPGEGATFRVYLPLVDTVGVSPDDDNHKQMITDGLKGELLLLVDDEQLIVHSMQEVLEDLGYQVVTAKNGVEGLERFKQYGDNVAAIITDVVMPEMGGADMFREIRRINATVPVIFMTGYDQGHINLRGDEKNHTMVLLKPVQIQELSQAIRKILAHL